MTTLISFLSGTGLLISLLGCLAGCVLRLRQSDPRAAMAAMPPLLRSYLAMGGWVSDHAVVDAQLGTLHVFTGLEIRAIPPARARLLRAAGA